MLIGRSGHARGFAMAYKYKFNGMEWQDELGLNLYDMDMRDYDPAIGRWLGIDPVTHYDMSPYEGMDNNPVSIADPSGADGHGAGGIYTNAYGVANYQGYNGYNTPMSNFGAFEGGFMSVADEMGTGIFSTTDASEMKDIVSFYAMQNGFTKYTYNYYDTEYKQIGVGIGTFKISGQYGGDGSGSIMDYVHRFLYATDQINPIALAWDGIKAKFTGSDRFGNRLSPVESSMKIATAIPVGRYASATESVLSHIFRDAVGHVNPATVTSQMRYFNLFEKVASNPNNLVPTVNAAAEAAGVATYNQTFRNGSTVWVMVRNGKIFNAGVNVP